MTQNTAIEFSNLTYVLNGTTILHSISGAITSGKITAFIGPSGSGKTTLLKIFNQLISETSGTITILGKHISAYSPTELRQTVGIALQSAPVLRASVFENLSLPLKLKGQQLPKEKAIEMLHLVGLDESFLGHAAHELSGGQRQRLSIARTLINEPKILLLDEITSALDPSASHEIEELIKKITQQYGVTTIWITHNSQQALSVSDELLLLVKGEIKLHGATAEYVATNNAELMQFLNGGYNG